MSEEKDEGQLLAEKVEMAKDKLAAATSADAKEKAGIALGEAKKDLAAFKRANKKPKQATYKNMCKGSFTLPGQTWQAGKSLPVTDEMAASKKFQHAVKIGVLKKG